MGQGGRTTSTSSSHTSYSRGTLQRMFSSYLSVSLEGAAKGPYRSFVDRGLKRKNLSGLMESVQSFVHPVQKLALAALSPSTVPDEEVDDCSQVTEAGIRLRALLPQIPTATDVYHPRDLTYERTASVSTLNWTQEFDAMSLPTFGRQYVQLVHTPMDVMHECLKLQLELKLPKEPSPLSVTQLVRECRDTLEEAIKARKQYREVMKVITNGNQWREEEVDGDMEFFEKDLNEVLNLYFKYLQTWVQVSSGHVLEEEWRHVKQICTHIRSGQAEAGRRFCDMASHLLESIGDMLEVKMDENCSPLYHLEGTADHRRAVVGESCRKFKELFVEVRERASKAIGFAKMLRKDLEIAADFRIEVEMVELMSILKSSDHTRVILPNHTGKLIFVPEHMADHPNDIQQMLSVSFTHSDNGFDLKDSYLLLVAMDTGESVGTWTGNSIEMKTSAETTIAISEISVDAKYLKMIVANSTDLHRSRTSFLNAVGKTVYLENEQTSSHENVAHRINDLKMAASKLGRQLMRTCSQVSNYVITEEGMSRSHDDHLKPYQAAMHSCFNLGFEYIREVFRLVGDEMAYRELGSAVLKYAEQWMRFVLEKCDRGRGTRPRWATLGLDFLTVACAPRQLAVIAPTEFEALKKLMNRCLDHVIGEAPPTQGYGSYNIFRTPVRPSNRPPVRARPSKPAHLVSALSLPQSQSLCKMDNVMEEEEGEGEGEGGREKESTPARGQHRVTFQSYSKDAAGLELEPVEGGVSISPPVSTESISSGHHSPPVSCSDVYCTPTMAISTCTPTLPYPISSPLPHPHPLSLKDMERIDSNTSTASATELYGSPFLRSPSLSSSFSSGNEGNGQEDRWSTIRKKIDLIEMNRERELRRKKMIGRVKSTQPSAAHPVKLSNLCQTHFKWQRGRKLGEGRFGKVYECLNLDTGEMMAVKQMSAQEKDTGTLQTVCDEIANIQRVTHQNIVKFHGLEVHHMELYLFMEYCPEGTLWSIAQQGLPEQMIRRYTRDLLRAVDMLHDRGIVHRDIKGANIFLSNDSIKLGDFGLSVQLKNFNKTMPNEIRQQVGTVPYLSPEVVLKQDMGRPLDIWSVGCVVIEMATGKLPWSECDHQYQIMFQIGTGKSPPLSQSALSEEGHHFLSHCFQSDPTLRWKASQLLSHPFVKITDDD